MDQQHRMLPGMMDPAKYDFYRADHIEGVLDHSVETVLAGLLED
jgi:hypothetical protein